MKTLEFPERSVEAELISFLLDAWEHSDRVVDQLLLILQDEEDWEAKLRELNERKANLPANKFSKLRKVVRDVLAERLPYSQFEEVAAEVRKVRK
jgi:hypothetical protein